jgi:hypothetical protein
MILLSFKFFGYINYDLPDKIRLVKNQQERRDTNLWSKDVGLIENDDSLF